MTLKRTCKGICKNYTVKKPGSGGRYKSGQGRCQVCEVWLDYHGGHLKDGSPAKIDSKGWFCNCCNFRIRRNPRNMESKSKTRKKAKLELDSGGGSEQVIDLSYFNNRRGAMLRMLGEIIALHGNTVIQRLPRYKITDVEMEFGSNIGEVIRMAHADDPNKISLIVEFEIIKSKINSVPTKQDIQKHSKFDVRHFESEFDSWEHFLNRLGYDPWYRKDVNILTNRKYVTADRVQSVDEHNDYDSQTLDDLKTTIQNRLQDDPTMLKLFEQLDKKIPEYGSKKLQNIIKTLDN